MATINKKQLKNPMTSSKKTSDKDSYKEYNKYYSSSMWKDLRNRYLEKHPLCEVCMSHHRIVPAVEVHHMIPWSRGKDEKQKMKLLLEEKNLLSCCAKCHKLLHKKDRICHQEVLKDLSDSEYEEGHGLKFLK